MFSPATRSNYVDCLPLGKGTPSIDLEAEVAGWGFDTDDEQLVALKIISVHLVPLFECDVHDENSLICVAPINESERFCDVSCTYFAIYSE